MENLHLKKIWKFKKKLETVILKFLKKNQKNTGPILEILCKKFSNGEKKPGKSFFVWKNIQNNFGKSNKKYGNQEKNMEF